MGARARPRAARTPRGPHRCRIATRTAALRPTTQNGKEVTLQNGRTQQIYYLPGSPRPARAGRRPCRAEVIESPADGPPFPEGHRVPPPAASVNEPAARGPRPQRTLNGLDQAVAPSQPPAHRPLDVRSGVRQPGQGTQDPRAAGRPQLAPRPYQGHSRSRVGCQRRRALRERRVREPELGEPSGCRRPPGRGMPAPAEAIRVLYASPTGRRHRPHPADGPALRRAAATVNRTACRRLHPPSGTPSGRASCPQAAPCGAQVVLSWWAATPSRMTS